MHVEVIIFDSVRFLLKKITKSNYLKKKTKPNRNQVKPTGSVFLGQKPVQTGLGFLGFGSVFSGFGLVFLVWLDFFGLARFFLFGSGFFWFFCFNSVFLVFCL